MKKILIVEDDPSTTEFIHMMLSAAGYEAAHIGNGAKAVEMAKAEKPDLILLDVMLPGMDGHAIQVQLLEDPQTKNIPIILMTARAQLEQVFVNAPNVVGFVAKPFNIKELQNTLKSVLK